MSQEMAQTDPEARFCWQRAATDEKSRADLSPTSWQMAKFTVDRSALATTPPSPGQGAV
ncbi:hypothetical protein AM571_PC00982 (plasmid) [Rhizobium etli 8C-3]|uniref:Uncharacterized protein n=1 Tax=Rhizobium etli 8C-3 TaxID=538025 RepID=A0A1L5PEW7_RHIET|nr:hypothetical protein AM571_PC00982 [Rhizobium etli 8C-3]